MGNLGDLHSLCPLFVSLTNTRVPSIRETELHGDLITSPAVRRLRARQMILVKSRVQHPGRVASIQIDDGSQIVVERDVDI